MGEYNKQQAQDLGAAIFETIEAVKDGLQPHDTGAAMNLLGKFTAASDEIAADPDAAVLDIVAGLASAVADSKRNPVVLE